MCILFTDQNRYKANGGPLKWNFEVLGMQRWDKPTDRTQGIDEKNGVKVFKKW